ncbi:hypothetical protein TRV_03343 [Trichophyton verrucosum HKI 0517]|uniref:FAD-binding domain-containing protein n=1 Tax=Trichophyton verrucosum (strain HKI 0517) TaxID=663202 RepID=D4D8A7_TRIVH|nr:uncharacterized protein TRV_03343 [Trichophyton verrucosum HKI 0517]EFE41926.1 hypothetical protein TRV_03343 [Trichophyton verrucosum HKI 0517]
MVQLRHHQRCEDLVEWRTNAHSIQPDDTIKEETGNIQHVIAENNNDTIPRVSSEARKTTTIQAKCVVGSDGAHSWVRHQLGIPMEGTSTDAVWGVIDAVFITDFPRAGCTS